MPTQIIFPMRTTGLSTEATANTKFRSLDTGGPSKGEAAVILGFCTFGLTATLYACLFVPKFGATVAALGQF